MPNLDAIVALRASAIAFHAPQVQMAPSDDQYSDLYTLCAARCCDAAIAFVNAESPATPTNIASNIRSASLLSPDSSGADSFEGPLASHTACELLNAAAWLSYQTSSDTAAHTPHTERLCPVDLVNSMAASAASLSDSQMYDRVCLRSQYVKGQIVMFAQNLLCRCALGGFSKHS
jgi:hypothetical protein